jgi:hypothetical protein
MGVKPKGSPKPERTAGPGDISACINCAGLAVFTATMGQRKMTYREELDLDAKTKKMLAVVRSQIREVNRA